MLNQLFRIYRKAFTFRRFSNLLKVLFSYTLSLIFRKPIVWGFPPVVMIEPTNICNLKCPLCPSGADDLTRERGFLSLERFKQIIDYITPYTLKLIFWNQGEPFLHPNFCEMVAYASEKKIYVMVSTNANIMPPPAEIIKAGLDELIVSLDGATQEVYNKYRQNGSLEQVLTNLSSLISAKKVAKATHPFIIWQFLVMKHNEHQLDSAKTIATEIGVDKFSLKTVQIFSREDIENYLPSNPKYYRPNSSILTAHSSHKNRCYRLWSQPVINWDGEVSVCCYDKDNLYKIGNINDKAFYDLWRCEAFTIFRQTVLKDRKRYPICCLCGEHSSLHLNKL